MFGALTTRRNVTPLTAPPDGKQAFTRRYRSFRRGAFGICAGTSATTIVRARAAFFLFCFFALLTFQRRLVNVRVANMHTTPRPLVLTTATRRGYEPASEEKGRSHVLFHLLLNHKCEGIVTM